MGLKNEYLNVIDKHVSNFFLKNSYIKNINSGYIFKKEDFLICISIKQKHEELYEKFSNSCWKIITDFKQIFGELNYDEPFSRKQLVIELSPRKLMDASGVGIKITQNDFEKIIEKDKLTESSFFHELTHRYSYSLLTREDVATTMQIFYILYKSYLNDKDIKKFFRTYFNIIKKPEKERKYFTDVDYFKGFIIAFEKLNIKYTDETNFDTVFQKLLKKSNKSQIKKLMKDLIKNN